MSRRSSSRKVSRSVAQTGLLFADAPTSPAEAAPAAPTGVRRNLLIRASAGTGKTFQLSGQFIDRLRITDAERILATTFTRAAAGEILERVLLRLARAALESDQLSELSRQIDPLHNQRLTAEKALECLSALTRDLHRVRVGTLDSFFIQLAQSFALELGLPPGWRILDPIEEQQLVTLAIERLLAHDEQGDVGRLLNLMGRGDAGRRVSNALRQTVKDFYEVYQQTDRAAWERVELPALLTEEQLKQAVNDFEVVWQHLPEDKNFAKAHKTACELLADGDWEAFLQKGFGKPVAAGEEVYCKKPIPEEVLAPCRALVWHARGVLIKQLAARTAATCGLLDRFHHELARLKEEHQGLTFSDVTRALGRGWRDAVLGRLDFRLDAAIEHLLLDEFQDTSIPQWQALAPLARLTAEEVDGSLFCVGDPKQAIYGWRGGVSELFNALEQQLPRVENQPLSKSFRSSPAVIETVNRVFQNLTRHPRLEDAASAVERWQSRFPLHETSRSELPGCVLLESTADADEDAHIESTARRVAELHRAAPEATIGVLAMRNKAVAALARSIRRRGVVASEEGGSALSDCVAVQVILSLLQWVDHPGDTAAHFHVATSPLGPAIGLDEDAADDEAAAVAHDIRRDLLERGYGAVVSDWAQVLAKHSDPRGVNRLVQLVDLAHGYSPHATLRPREFVEFVETQSQVQPASAPARVMTVHKSKGLEFDIVVLPELNSLLLGQQPKFVTASPSPVDPPDTVVRYANRELVALLPDELQQVFQADKERRIEERLCVLYVALTRARHALHLLVHPTPPEKLNTATQKSAETFSLTMAHLLRASLLGSEPLPPRERRLIEGNADWHNGVTKMQTAAPIPDDTKAAETKPLSIQLAPAETTSLARLQAVRPSRHGKEGVRLTDVVAVESSAARMRGTLMHAWFEEIDWLDDGVPDEALLRRIARRLEPHRLDIDACLSEFQAMLRNSDIAWVLSKKAYLSGEGLLAHVHRSPVEEEVSLRVQKERNFAVPLKDEIIRGCIDRLVLLQHGEQVVASDILDYKTDALSQLTAEAADERLAGYRKQLQLYRQAVCHIHQLLPDRVGARLVLLEPGRVEDLD